MQLYCPMCRQEYNDKVEECADCQCPLVETLSAEDEGNNVEWFCPQCDKDYDANTVECPLCEVELISSAGDDEAGGIDEDDIDFSEYELLTNYPTVQEAKIAVMVLATQDIHAALLDEDSASVYGGISIREFNGIGIAVSEDNLEIAKEILEDI